MTAFLYGSSQLELDTQMTSGTGSFVFIPRLAHFCWIGPRLPWAYGIALLSAAARGSVDDVILHHTDDLEDGPVLDALRASPAIRISKIDPQALLNTVGRELGIGGELNSIYCRISSPAILSDILRAAILYREGGVYLDVDTVTVAPYPFLTEIRQFIGVEHIVWPYWVKSSISPIIWGRTLALDVMRKAMRLAPEGWRLFRIFEGLYYRGINGAIMGGEPKAPLFEIYLRYMATLPTDKQSKPNALGPDLLQALVEEGKIQNLVVYGPEYFYPFAPEISEHWFRSCRDAPVALSAALKPKTVVVHWYGSVRTKYYVDQICPRYIREHKKTQLYSALVAEVLPGLLLDK